MKVTVVKPFGYCHGVKKAIDLAIKTRENNPNTPVYIYGNLVHNTHVRDVLNELNILSLTRDIDLSTLEKGMMITTAHGISQQIIQTIKENGFTHIDATCPLVYKSFQSIKKAVLENKIILYYGHKNHPEAIAALSIHSEKVMIFEQLDDLKNLSYEKEYVLTNQTTIRHEELEKYFFYLLNLKYKVDLLDEICNATKTRQTSLRGALQKNYYDLVIIVGDPTSNNSRQLYNIAKEINTNTHFVSSYLEIKKEWHNDKKTALISSGASTPNILVDQIVHYLKGIDMEKFDITNKKIIQL